jgi:hypothetical protein
MLMLLMYLCLSIIQNLDSLLLVLLLLLLLWNKSTISSKSSKIVGADKNDSSFEKSKVHYADNK